MKIINEEITMKFLQSNPEFTEPVKPSIHYTKIKYLNNMIEQDHRIVKKITNPALGYKNFNSANNTIAVIEAIAIIRKNQTTLAEFNRIKPTSPRSFIQFHTVISRECRIKVSIADQINLLVA